MQAVRACETLPGADRSSRALFREVSILSSKPFRFFLTNCNQTYAVPTNSSSWAWPEVTTERNSANAPGPAARIDSKASARTDRTLYTELPRVGGTRESVRFIRRFDT